MISTSQSSEKQKTRRKSSFKELLAGEFLFSKQAFQWYPYILFVIVLIAGLMFNEHSISTKKQKIKELEIEYKQIIGQLKYNNQYILYEENKQLVEQLKSYGFGKQDKHLYKIVIKRANENGE